MSRGAEVLGNSEGVVGDGGKTTGRGGRGGRSQVLTVVFRLLGVESSVK